MIFMFVKKCAMITYKFQTILTKNFRLSLMIFTIFKLYILLLNRLLDFFLVKCIIKFLFILKNNLDLIDIILLILLQYFQNRFILNETSLKIVI